MATSTDSTHHTATTELPARGLACSGLRLAVAVFSSGLALLAPAVASAATEDAKPQPPRQVEQTACPALLDHRVTRLQDEKVQSLCQYRGQVVLVVNTASLCGYTGQYKSLETLYSRYRGRGLVVLGFPSNDFGQQEPGSSREIAAFCENTFGVKFPMFVKTNVVPAGGQAVHPLFVALREQTGQAPRWNFHKYLIARDGQAVVSHGSQVDPLDRAFVRDVEKMLAQLS